MIKSISANRGSFKDVEFGPHFNVVLAERSERSGDKDSRNGSGKTSLLEILHFDLGATANADHALMVSALEAWRFETSFTARGANVIAARSTEQPSRVYLPAGLPGGTPTTLRADADGAGGRWLPNDEWRGLALSWLLFDLTEDELAEPGGPSARGLLSYFARRGRDAFSDPFTFFRSQPAVQRQVLNAYLLGLDWRYPARAQELRDKADRLRKARQALANAPLDEEHAASDATDLEGQLEARVILLSREVAEAAEQLAAFRVHPQYHDLEQEASELTRQLHELSADNVAERELIEFYERSLRDEQPAAPESLEAMYAEAGVAFSDAVRRQLVEVTDFHERLLTNRRDYLASEVERLHSNVAARAGRVTELTERRARLMAVLGEHGALEEFQRLQDLHNERVAELERVRGQLEQLQRFEEELTRVRLARDQLVLDARVAFNERRPLWGEAVDIFGANTAALYEQPGRLGINVNEQGGLNFKVDVARGQSQGVQEMMVFCYDLMLAQLWSQRPTAPGFVVHDSTIFDGVDERQVARALELAAAKSAEHDFQYICLLNSDAVPRGEFSDDFDFDDHVVLELSDLGEEGGLFGIRF
jgi:uncharacterized protein YydD (DUF2326 family)